MHAVSTLSIVGKWKLVETRFDLDDPQPLKNGRKGEIVEFTADGRVREPGCKPARSFGPVMYRLNTKKKPPHYDTFYASGMPLRNGIYRCEGDRLIICSTPTGVGRARRPTKFAGFTKAEEDRLRFVDIYERVSKRTPKRAEPVKSSSKAPAVRMLEANRLVSYLQKSSRKPPRDPGAGVAAEWIKVAELEVVSGCLWAGDPLCLNEEDGCLVKLATGTYVVAAQGIDVGGFRVVGRVRVYPKRVREDRLKAGPVIGETGTDSAAITVCDLRGLLSAIAGEEDSFARALQKQMRGPCGRLTTKVEAGVALLFVQSGFGDGAGSVYALLANGRRVGFHLEFVNAD